MSWYHTEGNCPSYIIFSSVSYRRNPSKLPFRSEKNAEALNEIEAIMTKNGFHREYLPNGRNPITLSYAEKQFFGRDLLDAAGDRSLYLNEPCNLAVAVGGPDLISIRSVLSGKAIAEGFKIAGEAEELLDRHFEFAYSDQVGYLTGDPAFCGSGCEIVSALFLPGLGESKEFESLRLSLFSCGCTLAPFFFCKDNPANLYILTKKVPLFCSEAQAIGDFEMLLDNIIKEEESRRRILFANKDKLLIDRAWRAYGTLLFSREMDESELNYLLSNIRLASSLAEDKKDLPPVEFSDLTCLLAEGSDSSLLANGCPECTGHEECRCYRAEYIRTYFSNRKRSDLSMAKT